MSPALIARSPDLTHLREAGYDIEVRDGWLLVKQVPYATASGTVAYGILVTELTTNGDVAGAPKDHTAYFVGEIPCNHHGQPLDAMIIDRQAVALGGGLTACCRFSSKPPEGFYPDYYAKMNRYATILTNYAQALQPNVTAKTFPPISTDEDESVFQYRDSASSRANITAITERLKLEKVAIIGLGGTGSYILDLVAKTPVEQIHLYDGGLLRTHNAFRAPGAATIDELRAAPKKVDYFQQRYAPMHRNIVAHPVHVDETNVDELREMTFVFLAMDGGPNERLVIEKLEEFGIPFAETGMGIYRADDMLGGQLRTTLSAPGHRRHVKKWVSFGETVEDEYDHNIQIADLNMLNAAEAVIRWKKYVSFYADLGGEYTSIYKITHNRLINEDQEECAE